MYKFRPLRISFSIAVTVIAVFAGPFTFALTPDAARLQASCEELLGVEPLYDASVSKALRALKSVERDTVHVPELVPLLQKVRALSQSLQHRGAIPLISMIDDQTARGHVTYHGFWYTIILHLLLRDHRVNDALVKKIIAAGFLAASHVRPSSRFRRLFLVFEDTWDMSLRGLNYSLQTNIGNVFGHRAIYIPLIDQVDSPLAVAIFKEGQYVSAFQPTVFVVGISSSDSNSFDRDTEQTALQLAAHDLAHADDFWRIAAVRSQNRLARAHQRILDAIQTSPLRLNQKKSLLLRYENLLFEYAGNAIQVLRMIADKPLHQLWRQSMANQFSDLAKALAATLETLAVFCVSTNRSCLYMITFISRIPGGEFSLFENCKEKS